MKKISFTFNNDEHYRKALRALIGFGLMPSGLAMKYMAEGGGRCIVCLGNSGQTYALYAYAAQPESINMSAIESINMSAIEGINMSAIEYEL